MVLVAVSLAFSWRVGHALPVNTLLVGLTAPANGATFSAPANIVLTATATDFDGEGIDKVEFFNGTTWLGTDTTAPYSFTWSNVPAGSYSLTAKATNGIGVTRTSVPVTITVSNLPIYAAQFIGQSVPTTMFAGQTYAVSVQMKNVGSATWTAAESYNLGSQNPQDNLNWGLGRVGTPGSIGNGQTTTFNFTARAPTTPGTYNFQWRMVRDGVTWFGDITPNIAVNVVPNPPPIVALTSPAEGAVVISGQTTSITASASDANGISKVEFLDGAMLIGTDTTAPYSVPWSSTVLGSHSLTARATDGVGVVGISAPVIATVVKVALSANNKTVTSTVLAGNTASAAFRMATAGKLRFQTSVGGLWVEQSPLDEWLEPESGITAAQFEVLATSAGGVLPSSGTMNVWLNLGSATRDWVLTRSVTGTSQAVIAIQIRRVGTTTVLASANVTLNATVTPPPNIPPSVALTGPSNGQVFHVPQGGTANIPLAATASDADGTVSKVEFFQSASTTAIATDTTAPSPFTGSWNNVPVGSYSLTAKATDNDGASTTSASVSVIVNALPTVSLPAPALQNGPNCSFTLNATASDSDGTISKLEYFKDGVLFSTDTAAPYSAAFATTAPSSNAFTVKATDNRGGMTTSPPVTVVCNALPTVGITAPASGASLPAPVSLTATAADSDGSIASVQYFEGATAISPVLTASPYTHAWSTATAGSHTITAKAIDNRGAATTSSAVTFTVVTVPTITVALTAPLAGASFPAPQPIPLSATATTTSGTITQVEFLDGATVVFTATSATSTFTGSWTGASVGSHSLTARATTSSGVSATSSPAVPITVINPPPTITLTAPSAGATFPPGADITLSATASDANGTITQVEFFSDGVSLAGTAASPNPDTNAPYSFTWSNVAAGSYSLTAKATDNLGATTTTPAITITVAEPAMCFILPLKPGSMP
ncbi:MAG: Ig-like domain-containing protein [Xanthomonadaceae bacterium]|nr:Ig-like domain-containing protein [Xanthomonadaceae bacterium]